MKKNKIFCLLATGIAFTFSACNNSGDNTATNDSTNTRTTTTTSTNNYAARADTFRTNVQKGYYLNPRTGKAYKNLTIDTTTGAVTDETGKAVKRYVDTRNWWVYDTNSWDTIGSAQMKDGNLIYPGTNGEWETYDKKWMDDNMGDSTMNNSNMNNASDNGINNSGHTKVKVSDNGKKIKIKEKKQ